MKHNFERADGALAAVRNLLDAGKPQEAADVLRRFGTGSLELGNAYGVCLMRAGDFSRAVEVYRSLLLSGGGACLKADVPTAVKTNYAMALLLAGNVYGCLFALRETAQEQDPTVIRLRAAIDRWLGSLKWWQRLWFKAAGEVPAKPVPLDFAPGELFEKSPLRPAA
jgi:Flp pilus assembly protein TadD